MKAAGKVLKLVDANAAAELATFEGVHENLHAALLKLELRDKEVAQITARNHQVENELKRVEQHNLNLVLELIGLKREQVAAPSVRVRRS
jgi:hypothetical protein